MFSISLILHILTLPTYFVNNKLKNGKPLITTYAVATGVKCFIFYLPEERICAATFTSSLFMWLINQPAMLLFTLPTSTIVGPSLSI